MNVMRVKTGILFALFLVPFIADAEIVRVIYREDGVSVMQLVPGTCTQESLKLCFDKEQEKLPDLKGLPYDDMDRSSLPQSRKDRDKWRGSKGQGVHVDTSLVTKDEKLAELEAKLDEELAKDAPSAAKVARIERLIEKLKKMELKTTVIPSEKLAEFEEQNKGFLSTIFGAIKNTISSVASSVASSIESGMLAIRDVVTETLKIGSREKPAGITVYDQETGDPFCLVVKNGVPTSLAGECADIAAAQVAAAAASQSADNDTFPPVITLSGEAEVSLSKGDGYSDPGATVDDNVNKNLGIQTTGLPIDTSKPGEYTITYDATDQAGNKAVQVKRVVKILDPSAKPPKEEPKTEPPAPQDEEEQIPTPAPDEETQKPAKDPDPQPEPEANASGTASSTESQ